MYVQAYHVGGFERSLLYLTMIVQTVLIDAIREICELQRQAERENLQQYSQQQMNL